MRSPIPSPGAAREAKADEEAKKKADAAAEKKAEEELKKEAEAAKVKAEALEKKLRELITISEFKNRIGDSLLGENC